MWLQIFLGILALLGYAVMWFALFGKKKDVDGFDVGFSSSIVELIFDITFKIAPTLIKRILIFLIGLFTAVIFSLGFLYS